MQLVTTIRHNPGGASSNEALMLGLAILKHDERHLRRKVITLTNGAKIFVDFTEPVVLADGDELVLDDGSFAKILAAEEPLYAVTASNPLHLTELAWHIGNRHLAAAILIDQIHILRDHVIKSMLEGLGATVSEISAPFTPTRGAYSSHHGHEHGNAPHHHHDHEHDNAPHHHHDHA